MVKAHSELRSSCTQCCHPPIRGQVRERQCLHQRGGEPGPWGGWLELTPHGSGCKLLGEPQGRGLRASPPAQPRAGAWMWLNPGLWPGARLCAPGSALELPLGAWGHGGGGRGLHPSASSLFPFHKPGEAFPFPSPRPVPAGQQEADPTCAQLQHSGGSQELLGVGRTHAERVWFP